MSETYTEKAHFRIIIEGDYSSGNLLKEEVDSESTGTLQDAIWDYVTNNIIDYYRDADIKIDKLEIIKE